MNFKLTKEQAFVRELVDKYGVNEVSRISRKTNYEEIVNYNIDEMARFLANCFGGGTAKVKAMKLWLKSEAE